MRILIDIGHPAHLHLFKNLAFELQRKGHQFLFTCRDKEVILDLLNHYGFDFISFDRTKHGLINKLTGLLQFNRKMWQVARAFKADLFISHNSPYAAQVAWLMGKPHIALEDTGNREQTMLANPFNATVLTSTSLSRKYGHKQIRYDGYHELAYLHPKRFNPDGSVLKQLGVGDDEKYIIVRHIVWSATHDVGQQGLNLEKNPHIIYELAKHARVFITSEGNLPPLLESFRIRIPPHRIHDALAFAALVISEGGTIASEAAMLGTPVIHVSSIKAAVIEDQKEYGLMFNGTTGADVLEKALHILSDSSVKQRLQKLRRQMLAEKIDLTAFLVWFVENYPESFKVMKENPEYQDRFKYPTAHLAESAK